MDSVTVVILLMLLSSCAAGYILGRSAFPESSGRRIDTILLTPDGDAAEQQMQQIFHLAGKLIIPMAGPMLRGGFSFTVNQGKPLRTQTGALRFSCGRRGAPDSYLDRTGNVLGERKVNLFSAQAESGVNVSLQQTGSIPLRWQSMSG